MINLTPPPSQIFTKMCILSLAVFIVLHHVNIINIGCSTHVCTLVEEWTFHFLQGGQWHCSLTNLFHVCVETNYFFHYSVYMYTVHVTYMSTESKHIPPPCPLNPFESLLPPTCNQIELLYYWVFYKLIWLVFNTRSLSVLEFKFNAHLQVVLSRNYLSKQTAFSIIFWFGDLYWKITSVHANKYPFKSPQCPLTKIYVKRKTS